MVDKKRAIGYTDYFKNRQSSPAERIVKKTTEDGAEEELDTTKLTPADQRKLAIKRRLLKKAGK